jgi:Cu+-exporting ATPase
MELKTSELCYHCGDECGHESLVAYDKNFCCNGCKTVYAILNQNDLCEYYEINEQPGIKQLNETWNDKFAYLDKEEFKKEIVQFSNKEISQATFYVPTMHCSSCLWLLENLNKLNENIISSRVNFVKKEVFIVWNATISLRQLVEQLNAIGYEPYFEIGSKETKKANPNKKRIIKIAVAGFAFSNIMMLSLPDYLSTGNLSQEFSWVFKNLSVLLSLPVFFYCSREFFANAYTGVKNKILNIDTPIAVALIIIFGRSLFDIYIAGHTGYLDSLSGIVFFMLVGRWLQDKTNENLTFERDYKSFFPIAVTVLKNNAKESVAIQNLKVDDIIEIHHGEIIPADSLLSKGRAEIDYSFVTGESKTQEANVGEIIYAGGVQKGALIELIVLKEVSQSYLTNLWNKDTFINPESTKEKWVDVLSKYFTYLVFVLAAIAAFYWNMMGESVRMWNAITTVLIVACPCALLLAANYTQGHILRILSKNKLYLKNAEVIDDLGEVNHLVFDKTGTLTDQRIKQVKYNGQALSKLEKQIIYSAAASITHPLSHAIMIYLGKQSKVDILGIKDLNGQGFEVLTKDAFLKIGLPRLFELDDEGKGTELLVAMEDKVIGKFIVENRYREGIDKLIAELQGKYKMTVLSGDNDAEQKRLAEKFGKNVKLVFGNSPEDKLEYVKKLQETEKVLMVGDGLNDSGALKQSDFGLVVTDNLNNFTPASDGIMSTDNFSKLFRFLQVAKGAKKVIRICFSISLIYNLVGLFFALQGILSPVIAAILMPLSSISIIGLTYGMSFMLARKYSVQ